MFPKNGPEKPVQWRFRWNDLHSYGQFLWIVVCNARCINRPHRRVSTCGSAAILPLGAEILLTLTPKMARLARPLLGTRIQTLAQDKFRWICARPAHWWRLADGVNHFDVLCGTLLFTVEVPVPGLWNHWFLHPHFWGQAFDFSQAFRMSTDYRASIRNARNSFSTASPRQFLRNVYPIFEMSIQFFCHWERILAVEFASGPKTFRAFEKEKLDATQWKS